jgi:hypothetical protein
LRSKKLAVVTPTMPAPITATLVLAPQAPSFPLERSPTEGPILRIADDAIKLRERRIPRVFF